MRIKKILRYFFLGSLTIGASLIEGLLSFSGMLTLWPILPVALVAVALLELYEGEIYFKNLKGALKKLSTKHYNENFLARKYLETKLSNDLEIESDERLPECIKEYVKLLKKIEEIKRNPSKKKKDRTEKKLFKKEKKDIEKLVAKLIFSFDLKNLTDKEIHYQESLKPWISEADKKRWKTKSTRNRWILRGMTGLCIIGSILMGIGTLFLLLEAVTTIPFFMTFTLPTIAVVSATLSIISAIAYGLLTYNLTINLINHETLGRWLETIRNIKHEGWSARSIFKGLTAISLLGLTLAMTICTAGTWWTIAKNARYISRWLNIPFIFMEIFHPIMVGIFSIVTSLQNSTQSLSLFGLFSKDSRPQASFFQRSKRALQRVWAQENWLQLINPFRLILICTFTPLRILLFLGHLFSAGVSNDRMPGIPEPISIGMTILFEGLGDLSYFFSPSEEGHSDESRDIPYRFLSLLFLPLSLLSKGWDQLARTKQKDIADKRFKDLENFMNSNDKNDPTLPINQDTDTVPILTNFKEKSLTEVSPSHSLKKVGSFALIVAKKKSTYLSTNTFFSPSIRDLRNTRENCVKSDHSSDCVLSSYS